MFRDSFFFSSPEGGVNVHGLCFVKEIDEELES